MEAVKLLAGLVLFGLAFRYSGEIEIPKVKFSLRELLWPRMRTDP